MHDNKKEEDDIELDTEDVDDSVVAEEHQGDVIKKLKDKLKGAEEKAKEYLDSWQRAQADFLNIRKRDEEAKTEFLKFAHSDLLTQLMPVLDSLTLAVQHGSKECEAVYKQLMQILKQNGLEESNPVGEMFDPRFHESIGTVDTEEKGDDHKILEVMQKGYILHGKIIRPAKVKIGQINNR
jgi:molecular chaperone GrpE